MTSKTRPIELNDSHSLEDALREFGRAHRLDLLAPKVGCSANVLRNKLNPDQEFHKLTLLETVLLASNTGDTSILRAASNMLGHDIHQLKATDTEAPLMHLVFKSVGGAANVATLFDKFNHDLYIDPEEAKLLSAAADNVIKTMQELKGSLNTKKEA